MAQVYQKQYECLNCKKPIRLSKIENPPTGQKRKWDKFELDGVTPHICSNNKSEEDLPTGAPQKAIDEELKALRDLLTAATRRIDTILQQTNL